MCKGDIYIDGDYAERKFIENIVGRNIINLQKQKYHISKSLVGYFDVYIPLKMFFRFAKEYQKIIINYRHDVVLMRANSDARYCTSDRYC